MFYDRMPTSFPDGREEAAHDIHRGVLKLKTYGYPARWRDGYARFLKKQYDVELDDVAGCEVNDAFLRYVEEYNTRVEEELAKRFGDGVLSAMQKEADRLATRKVKKRQSR